MCAGKRVGVLRAGRGHAQLPIRLHHCHFCARPALSVPQGPHAEPESAPEPRIHTTWTQTSRFHTTGPPPACLLPPAMAGLATPSWAAWRVVVVMLQYSTI